MLLKEHVDKAADPKAELDGIVKRIKSNNNRETPPALPVSPGRCGRQHAGRPAQAAAPTWRRARRCRSGCDPPRAS